LLWFLINVGIFAEDTARKYAQIVLSETLRSEALRSLRDRAIMAGAGSQRFI
jgi:hypothetical protein